MEIPTFKQWYKQEIKSIYDGANGEITYKEIYESYPEKDLFPRYYRMLTEESRAGNRIPDKILDKLTPQQRYQFLHDQARLYETYIPIEIRKLPREIKKPVGRPRKIKIGRIVSYADILLYECKNKNK